MSLNPHGLGTRVMVTASTIRKDDIISGKGLIYGRHRHVDMQPSWDEDGETRGYRVPFVHVGHRDAYTGPEEKVDASDPTRADALFLVQSVEEDTTWVHVIRLDEKFDHYYRSEVVRFAMSDNAEFGVPSVERVAFARTERSICIGDIIQSGRFADSTIFKQHQTGIAKPTAASRFLVRGINMQGGGTGHGPNDVFPDGRYVTAVEVNDDNTVREGSNTIGFYMSDSFSAPYMVNAVLRIGSAKALHVEIDPVS